jgi:hypothetical protein
MHTVRNRHASKTRAEAVRSKRGAKSPASQAPSGFPGDLIVPPHRGAVITSALWPQDGAVLPVAMGRKALRNAERRAAAVARVAAVASAVEDLIILPVLAEPEVVVPVLPPAEVLSASQPLPAGRALVARRQGFVDVIAFALRDSGRRLARWSSARRRADDMKQKLARAEARMRAMEAQLAALQALQDQVRQAG